jgi:phenolic acid decarboxylase
MKLKEQDNPMTFELSDNAVPTTGELVVRLMKTAQEDIDTAFYFRCAIEHPEMIAAYMNAYIAMQTD